MKKKQSEAKKSKKPSNQAIRIEENKRLLKQISQTIEKERIKELKSLIDLNVFLETTSSDGTTPLHDAIYKDQITVVRWLLIQKADLEATFENDTPLIISVMANRPQITELLVEQKANINAVTPIDRTALHYAAITGNKYSAELLLERKASATAKDIDGFEPLHLAVKNYADGVVKLLLEKKSCANTKDKQGKTLMAHAALSSFCSEKMIVLLLHYRATVDNKAQYMQPAGNEQKRIDLVRSCQKQERTKLSSLLSTSLLENFNRKRYNCLSSNKRLLEKFSDMVAEFSF